MDNARNQDQRIKIRYSNCQKKRAATALMVGEADPQNDFILISEPYLQRRCHAGFGRSWSVNHSGTNSRAIIAAPPGVPSVRLAQFSEPDNAFNLVTAEGIEFILGCVYFENGVIDEDKWTKLLKELVDFNENVIIIADTNAHSRLWGYDKSDPKGVKFEEVFTEGGMVVITPDYFPTFQNSRNQHSCIDIAFATPVLQQWLSERITGVTPSLSDHAIWELHLLSPMEADPSVKYKYKSTDWSMVGEKLDKKLERLVLPEKEKYGSKDLDNYVDQFTNIIKAVMEQCIPQAMGNPRARWWTTSLTQLKNRVMDGNASIAELEDAILKARNESWKKFIESNSSLGDAHLRRKLSSLDTKSPSPSTVKKVDGTYTRSSRETADYLLSQWFRFPDADANKQRFTGFYEEVIKKLEDEEIEQFENFKTEEILEAIACMRTDAAPGMDGIPAVLIQQLAVTLVPHLKLIYDLSIGINHTPRVWKTGQVVLIPKPDGGYRPITLLPIFVKILERLILKRLQLLDVTEKWLSAEQFAFRPGRSTNHALLNYASMASDYIKNKISNIVIHLDIKGAFDNVWAPILLRELDNLKCPTYLRLWIADYMLRRRQVIKTQMGEVSCNVQKSTPQGGSLSPIFWNIVINGLLKKLGPSTDFLQGYADDIVFSVKANSLEAAERKANSVLSIVEEWISKMRLEVNPKKCKVISFSTRRKVTHPVIRYGKDRLESVTEIKYLGLIFTRKLLWGQHINYVANKAMKALHYMNAIVKRNWGITGDYVASLYKAAIEPIMTYGALAWCNVTVKSSVWKPLRDVQRLAARMAACTSNRVQHMDLLNVVGFIPIEIRLQELAHSAWCRASNSDDFPLQTTTARMESLKSANHFSAVQQLKKWDQQLELSAPIQQESSALKCRLMRRTPEDLFNLQQHESTPTRGVVYYTDGSQTAEGTGAAYVKFIDGEASESWTTTLHKTSTVFQAELLAIDAVLTDAGSLNLVGHNVRIFSDSLSAIQALESSNRDKSIENIRKKLIRVGNVVDIKLGWVKAHDGFVGNEMADSLAKMSTARRPEMLALPISLNQVKSRIREQANEAWNVLWLNRRNSWAYNWMPKCNRMYKCPPMENKFINVFNSFMCNTIPLRGKLHQWGVINSPNCLYHPGFQETPRHVLFDCNHHEETRLVIRDYIRSKLGSPDFTFKNILAFPACVKFLAESLCNHLEASKPFNDRIRTLGAHSLR